MVAEQVTMIILGEKNQISQLFSEDATVPQPPGFRQMIIIYSGSGGHRVFCQKFIASVGCTIILCNVSRTDSCLNFRTRLN